MGNFSCENKCSHKNIYFFNSGPRAVTQKFSTADLLLRTKIQQYFSVSDSGCSFIGDTDELKEFNKKLEKLENTIAYLKDGKHDLEFQYSEITKELEDLKIREANMKNED